MENKPTVTISRLEKLYEQFPDASGKEINRMMYDQFGYKTVNGTNKKRAKINLGLLNPFSKMTKRIQWLMAMLIAFPDLSTAEIQASSRERFGFSKGMNQRVINDHRRYLKTFKAPMSINYAHMLIHSKNAGEPLNAI